jgi:hypothetical protein
MDSPTEIQVVVPGAVGTDGQRVRGAGCRPSSLVLLLAGGFVGLGAALGPGDQVGGEGEAVHVHADLGDQFLGGGVADRGDLIALRHLSRERGEYA